MTGGRGAGIDLTVRVSAARRVFAVGALGVLGALLLLLAAAAPPREPALLAVLLAAGIGAALLAMRLHAATARGLVLSGGTLREAGPDGRLLARMEDVEAVDRGAFAFKPSSGFLLTLRRGSPGGGVWAPGLWWRVGRRIGVGGVMRGAEARTLAEAIALEVAARAGR